MRASSDDDQAGRSYANDRPLWRGAPQRVWKSCSAARSGSAMKVEVTLDCNDVERLADFWERVLGYVRSPTVEGRYIALEPREQQGFTLTLQQVPERKIAKNRMQLDLLVPELQAEVIRNRSLGAT